MIQAEEIVHALLDADSQDAKQITSHPPQSIRRVQEEEDFGDEDETIKDILGPDYYDPRPPTQALPGSIERFGRWANVTIGGREFCISYLTPVAVYTPGEGIKFTQRDWSTTTSNHIADWAEEIGMTGPEGKRYKYGELKKRFQRIPQEEITRMFKEESAKVNWSKKDMKAAERVPSNGRGYKYVDPEHKVSLPRWEEPKEEI